MITRLTSFQRHLGCAALLAGMFAAASAQAQVATPTFNPPAGVYNSAQSVAITSATNGASIAYTTDGTIPTEGGGAVTHGILYSGAIAINTSTTLSAIAFKSGQTDSGVAVAGYTVQTTLALNILYSFNPANSGGINPAVGLVQGSDGNFYGTTENGGTSSDGTVFKLASTGGVWSLTTLHSFDGADGAAPLGVLIQATDGNLYGTTEIGGGLNDGTVFKITPAGVFTTLAIFNGLNGVNPTAGLVQGDDGAFYGTTSGNNNNYGNVFRMTPAGFVNNLHSFTGNDDGSYPLNGLVLATDGSFYGTTSSDGSGGYGTVFTITPVGGLNTMVSFDGNYGGAGFDATPVQARDGNFFGIIENYPNDHNATVTRMTPSGTLTTWASLSTSSNDGSQSDGPLVQASDSSFYGTTFNGGTSNNGTLFKMTLSGTLTVLVNFNVTDGAMPLAGLVQGSDGNFYGTTFTGGGANAGEIFQLVVPPASSTPAPTPAPSAGGGGGGAPSYWFLGCLAFAGILRWRHRQIQLLDLHGPGSP